MQEADQQEEPDQQQNEEEEAQEQVEGEHEQAEGEEEEEEEHGVEPEAAGPGSRCSSSPAGPSHPIGPALLARALSDAATGSGAAVAAGQVLASAVPHHLHCAQIPPGSKLLVREAFHQLSNTGCIVHDASLR